MNRNELINDYQSAFGAQPQLLVRSPGRVNIIGEHTDYNEGFVLPAAIDKAAYVAVGKRQDKEIKLFSSAFGRYFHCSLDTIHPGEEHWANYVLGVVDQLQKNGYPIDSGFNLTLTGDVPIGAGLSSSAAVECASIFALQQLFGLSIGKMELVKMAQKAEHTYAGVMCGIMDQFASVFGKKDCVVRLDCRSLEYEYVPLQLDGVKILLLNTNVKHSLSSSEYNTRREQCEQGVERIRRVYPEVLSLRDVTPEMLETILQAEDPLVYKRCKYVVSENQRLLAACEDLKQGRLAELGKKMFATHAGLSLDYEVSCRELDFLVDAVRNNPDVLGARMMGGGFGGCTINLVREQAIEPLVEALSRSYHQTTGLELTAYVAQTEDGVGLIA